MSRKHRNRPHPQPEEARREVQEVEVNESGEMRCTGRAAHWERIIINGFCFKCMKELAPNPA